jgi:XTP/dITP diphosphohydrolase
VSRGPATLLLATSNPGKRDEFARLLPPWVRIVTLDEMGLEPPPETGTTFAENAATKAISAATETGLLTLADDSGLEVDALGGAPGVRSARYAGEPASDERNRAALLTALESVPSADRGARFRCAVAVADRSELIATAEGTVEGRIARAPAGEFGFGYDPIFELPDGRTMAEVPPPEKNRISHRAAAYAAVLPRLRSALGAGAEEEIVR